MMRMMASMAAVLLAAGLVGACGGPAAAPAADSIPSTTDKASVSVSTATSAAVSANTAERNAVLDAARNAAIRHSVLDAEEMDQAIGDMEAVSTGAFLESIRAQRDELKARAVDSGIRRSVALGDVTLIDHSPGAATVDVRVRTKTSWPTVTDVLAERTMRLSMRDVGGAWKVSGLRYLGDAQTVSKGTPLTRPPAATIPAPSARPEQSTPEAPPVKKAVTYTEICAQTMEYLTEAEKAQKLWGEPWNRMEAAEGFLAYWSGTPAWDTLTAQEKSINTQAIRAAGKGRC